jgi:hypothetical protein
LAASSAFLRPTRLDICCACRTCRHARDSVTHDQGLCADRSCLRLGQQAGKVPRLARQHLEHTI